MEVELAAPPRCPGCSGLCAWRRQPATQRGVFAASRAFAVGDRVVLTLPERYVLLASLLLYGLPLAALVLGAAVGGAFSGSDAGAALGAAAAVAVSLLAAPRLRRRLERRTLERLEVVLGTPADAATHSL